jgi:hypothetical protein
MLAELKQWAGIPSSTRCFFKTINYNSIHDGLGRVSYSIFTFLACSIRFCSLNFALYLECLGFVLNLYPQQGHHNPSHFMNKSHWLQRLCPLA